MISRFFSEIFGEEKSDLVKWFDKKRKSQPRSLSFAGSHVEGLEQRVLLTTNVGSDPDDPAPLNGSETTTFSTTEDNLSPALNLSVINGGSQIGSIVVDGETNGTVNVLPGNTSITFDPAPDFSGIAKFRYNVLADANLAYVIVNVAAVNDDPVNNGLGNLTVTEDSGANALPDYTISDVDDGGGTFSIEFDANEGTFAASASGGATVMNSGTSTVEISGTRADVNETLKSLTYTPTSQVAVTDTISVSTSDDSTGTDNDTFEIAITGVNDGPTHAATGVTTGNVLEDDAADLFTNLGGSLVVSDVDAAGDPVVTTVSVNSGGILTTTGPTADVTQTINSASSITFTGEVADVNDALLTLQYEPADDFNGNETLTISTNDQGNNPSGALIKNDTVTIVVDPENDAPVITVPGTILSAGEDTPLNITAQVQATDIDVLTGIMTGSVAVDSGASVSLAGSPFAATVPFSGTLTQINVALGNIVFQGAADDGTSLVTATVTVNDNGNTGAGGPGNTVETFQIQLSPVNDAPEITAPATQPVDVPEDTLNFPFNGVNEISVSDDDSGPDIVRVTLALNQGGTLSAALSGGASSIGDGTSSLQINGNMADIDATIANLLYSPAADYFGAETLTVTAEDFGSIGGGGAQTTIENIAINVTPVNDPPTFTNPVTLPTIDEDSGVHTVPGAITGISAGPANETGATLVFSTTDPRFSMFSVDTATGDLTYQLAPNVNSGLGPILVNVTVSDDGGTPGTNAPENLDDTTVTINNALEFNVNSFDDGPDFSFDQNVISFSESAAAQLFDETVAGPTGGLDFLNILNMGSLDEAGQTVDVVTITNSNPSFFTVGNEPQIVGGFPGAVVGDELDLRFELAPSVSGTVLVDVVLEDSGLDTGGHENVSVTRTFTIQVDGTNNAPDVNPLPGAQTMAEDTTLELPTIGIDDDAVAPDQIAVYLTVNNGTLDFATSAGLTFDDGNFGTMMDPQTPAPVTLPASFFRAVGTREAINEALLNNMDGAGLLYTPNAGFNGDDGGAPDDVLDIFVDDLGNTGVGAPLDSGVGAHQIDIEITKVSDDTVVGPAMFSDLTRAEDAATDVIPLGISPFVGSNYFTDEDASDIPPQPISLTVTSSNPAVVAASLSFGNLELDYQPDASGTVTITVEASDGGSTATQTFDINVIDDPEAPVVANQIPDYTDPVTAPSMGDPGSVGSVDEDFTPINIQLEDGAMPVFSDVDVPFGDTLTFTASLTGPDIVTLTVEQFEADLMANPSDLRLVITPKADLFSTGGPDPTVITVTAEDSTGNMVSDSFNFIVDPVNDAPIGVLDEVSVDEDSGATTIILTLNDLPGPVTATDEVGQTVSLIGIGSSASNGTVTVLPGGTSVSYTPDPNFNGTDTFTYNIVDDHPTDPKVSSPSGTVNITVNPVNDAPVIKLSGADIVAGDAISGSEDTDVSLAPIDLTDIDGTGGNFTLSLSAPNGSFRVADPTSLEPGDTHEDINVLSAGAGSATVEGSLADLNSFLNDSSRGLVYLGNLHLNDNNPSDPSDVLSITLDDNGFDGSGPDMTDTKTLDINLAPVDEVLYSLSGSGTINEVGAEEGTVEVPLLTGGGTSVVTLDATAGPPDEIGSFVINSFTQVGATAVTGDLLATDITVSFSGVTTSLATATISINQLRSGTATLDFTATDSDGDTTPYELMIEVKGSNEPPVISIASDPLTTDPGTAVFLFNQVTIEPGPTFDFPAGQFLTAVTVINDNPDLFDVQPTLVSFSPGDFNPTILQFTSKSGVEGFANVTVFAQDSEGADSTDSFLIQVGNPSSDTTAPTISAVHVSNSGWDAGFLGEVPNGDAIGINIPAGAGQDDPIAQNNVNQVIIDFDEAVQGSGIGGTFTNSDFGVVGTDTVNFVGGLIPIDTITYDSINNRATLNLSVSLPSDRYTVFASDAITDIAGNMLDGEWSDGISTFNSGNGAAGGDFEFNVNVLQGDSSQNGVVDSTDIVAIAVSFNSIVGDTLYDATADIDGDGTNGIGDLIAIASNFNQVLPPPSTAFPAVAAAVDSAMEDLDELNDELEGLDGLEEFI